jgi:predicted transcriptional regulator
MPRGALEVPWRRLKVMRDLAQGEMTQGQIAKKYGVTQGAISQFADRNSDQIVEIAADLNNQFAGIAFAEKANRVAELSNDAEKVGELLADPATAARAGVQYAEMARVRQSALRAISEELGQLPSRMQVQVTGSLDVQVNGVDVGDLK